MICKQLLYLPIGRRKWQSTPVLLPGKSHRQRSLVGCSPWVSKSQTQLNDFTSSWLRWYYPILFVQSPSHVWLFVTPWTAACQACLALTISRVCPSSCPFNWWCHPTVSSSVTLFSFGLQSFSASGSFLNESTLCIRWPKYWSFSFSISISSKYSELISFTIDWFDLLDVHRTLKSLLQHHSLKASILRHSAFFMVQLTSVHD